MDVIRRAKLLEAAVVVLCVGMGAKATAQSSGTTFGLSAGIGHSDNIAREPAGEIDESFATAGLVMNAETEGRLSYSIDADVAYVDYFDDTFDSEVVGGLYGLVNYQLVPDRFSWTFEDTYGQAQLNPFRPDTPDNRESVNFFSTGPDIALPVGGRNFFDVGGRYSDARYEDSELDNTRVGGTAALRRQLSASSLVAVGVQADEIEYDDVEVKYDVQNAFLRYAVDTSRTQLALDAGVTELDRDGETNDGTLLRLNFARELSDATRFNIAAGQRFSDASDVFRALQRRSSIEPETSPTETTSDAFKYRYATIGFGFQKNRTDMGFDVGLNRERYLEQTDRDREYVNYSVYLGRKLSRTLKASIGARWLESDYENVDFDSENIRLRGSLSWRAGANTFVELEINYSDQSSSTPANDYEENRALLIFSYYPRGEQF